MRRWILPVLAALAAGLVPPATATAVDPAPVVVIAGDSNTASAYLPERDRFLRRLSDRVCGMSCGQPGYASVRSAAVPGLRLTGPGGLREQWDSILSSDPRPTTILLAIGTNDAGLVSDAEFTAAYRDVVDRATAAGVRVIPATMPADNPHDAWYYQGYAPGVSKASAIYWWSQWITSTYGASNVAQFNAATKLPSSRDLDCTYEWNNNAPICSPGDGLHMNRLGVVTIADSVPLERIA